MQTLSSAKLTWSASLSASENTATVAMPISLQARMIRTAISPRFAINIFENNAMPPKEGSEAGADYFTSAKENSPLTASLPFTVPFPSAK